MEPKAAFWGLFGIEATRVFWSVALEGVLLRVVGMRASSEPLRGLFPRHFHIQYAIVTNSIITTTSPMPTPIADPVVSFEVVLESTPPNGVALSSRTQCPSEHILSPEHSLAVEHVVIGAMLVLTELGWIEATVLGLETAVSI